MQRKIFPVILAAAVALSLFINFRLAATVDSLHADIYEMLLEQHLFNSQLIGQLDAGAVDTARGLLQRELDIKGPIVAIYLIEHCSGELESEPNDICREHTTP